MGGAMASKAEISRACGACRLTLNDPTPQMYLLCACEDCRQAAAWAATKGGIAPRDIIYSVYCRSDFSDLRAAGQYVRGAATGRRAVDADLL